MSRQASLCCHGLPAAGPQNTCPHRPDATRGRGMMIGMKRLPLVIVALIAVVSAACSAASLPSGGAAVPASPAPSSTALATEFASARAATPQPTPAPTPAVLFRALDTPVG